MVQLSNVTVPLGPLESVLALDAVTVAVNVTDCPDVDALGAEARVVVVASV